MRSATEAPTTSRRSPRDEVSAQVERLEGDLVALRRDIHQHPELSGAEHATAEKVAGWLRRLGLEVRTGVGGTGVVAELAGASAGPRLLIRADMDALPIDERTGLDFASSVPRVMHACGHDAHTAALLGAASILFGMRDQLAGAVRFCFQPAEEILAGAAAMIADGVMEGVSGVVGAHVDSMLPFGSIAVRPGEFLAGADFFEVTIRGGGGHAARPHESVDPVYVACHLVVAAQEIISRETRPGEPVVLSFGAVEGGTAANIVVEQVILKGALRWFSEAERARVLERLPALIDGICRTFRARGELKLVASAPVTDNDGEALQRLSSIVADGGRAQLVDPGRLTVSDDVARLLRRAPGVYFLAGARAHGAPHHHPEFDIDERVIGLISDLLARYALRYLQPSV